MGERTETAILAGGCFWGMQEMFRTLDGVVSMRAGYTGGEVPDAVCQRDARQRRKRNDDHERFSSEAELVHGGGLLSRTL